MYLNSINITNETKGQKEMVETRSVQSTSTWSKKISYDLALQTEIDPILRRGMEYWIFLEISLLYVVHVLEQSSLPVISGIRPLPSGVNRLLCIFNLFLLMCKTSELFAK